MFYLCLRFQLKFKKNKNMNYDDVEEHVFNSPGMLGT